jgi:propanediol dehydratase large subunit
MYNGCVIKSDLIMRFIAMEYIEGQTRDEVMGRHSVKLSEA